MLPSTDDVELLDHNRPIPARIYAVHRFASETRSHSLLLTPEESTFADAIHKSRRHPSSTDALFFVKPGSQQSIHPSNRNQAMPRTPSHSLHSSRTLKSVKPLIRIPDEWQTHFRAHIIA